jgi:signal transduction histidine kinase
MRLAQVMGNLLMNAVRHGCGRPIEIVLSTEAGYAEVRVTDQGEGMTPETLAQVFTPFYQSQVNAGSLGLGLAVVRGIVERHGGSVRATSSGVGQGSTFTLRLPLERRLSGESALDARA